MYHKFILVLLVFLAFTNCSKEKCFMNHKVRLILINFIRGVRGFNKGDYFYANKKFSEETEF